MSTITSPPTVKSGSKMELFLQRYGSFKYSKDEINMLTHVSMKAVQHFAHAGFMAASVFPLAADYLDGISLPAGIKPSEWDAFHDLVFMDEIARCGYLGVIFGLACGNIIGAPPIIRFATEQQKRKYLPDILSGRKRFCLGVTEPDAGSDVAGITTTAERKGNKYIVNGNKKWITNAIWADYVTAAVRTGGPGQKGISVLIIPLSSPGVTRKRLFNSGVSASGRFHMLRGQSKKLIISR